MEAEGTQFKTSIHADLPEGHFEAWSCGKSIEGGAAHLRDYPADLKNDWTVAFLNKYAIHSAARDMALPGTC
jgi:hypothetical protein